MANYGMVIDLTRCAGCLTCVVSCQLTNNQRPGVAWGTVETVEAGAWPDSSRVFLPHACMHCDAPACVDACETGASYVREDGIVLVDYEVCMGCGSCEVACPYGARKMSTNDAWYFDAQEAAPYEALEAHPVGISEKCIFCANRIDQGLTTVCATNCPTGARVFGDLDDPESAVSIAIKETNATNMPGTSMYYAKGDYTVDLARVLMSTGLDDAVGETGGGTAEGAGAGVDPLLVGGGVAVAAVAIGVGVGVGVKKSNDKKKLQDKLQDKSQDEKEGE